MIDWKIALIVGLAFLGLRMAWADSKSAPTPPPTAVQHSQPKRAEVTRSSSISFDDELVEGMNKNPFDSVTSVRNKEMKETSRLYRVKGSFSSEIKTTAEEAGYVQ